MQNYSAFLSQFNPISKIIQLIGGIAEDYKIISSYLRHVKFKNGRKSIKFSILRVQCVKDSSTYSFLPSFAVPYKHYGSDVIYEVVENVFTSTDSIYETAKEFHLPYQTVMNWVIDIKNNFSTHMTEGQFRLNISLHGIDKPYQLMQYYSEDYCLARGLKEYDFHIYQLIQVKFTEKQPSIGFFRPLLI